MMTTIFGFLPLDCASAKAGNNKNIASSDIHFEDHPLFTATPRTDEFRFQHRARNVPGSPIAVHAEPRRPQARDRTFTPFPGF
jgi:hypothetical protein